MQFLLLTLALLLAADPYGSSRARMVDEDIAARGIRDAAVLRAMREVPRHLFVPPGLRARAYDDTPLPIGHGQTISQPYIVAYMSELLEVRPGHRVLEIGTGSGYQAAVLARMGAEVYTIEVVEALAASAKRALSSYANVRVRFGDGYQGWPDKAPFERILLTAAPPKIPAALVEQLKPGGKLVAPVGATPFEQEIVLLTKDASGRVSERRTLPVRFVPMVPGKAVPAGAKR